MFAVLFMVLLGGIPRRYWYLQLPAVLGWVNSEFTGQWTDTLGLAITGFSLLWLALTGKRAGPRDDPDG
ncbi:hypothetical protein [Amycolatopsis keratiniphila]|uniref:Uncharacterized protein n=1 Tax=Amycolatopsis keratiniphila subsp. keratiniphila TaxID=227715 RepID=A0A1W2LYC6_9PSEU|nr:hypothetical protein [Amycolatopsis keratiniphila]OLZ58107.1 hypothetical protein BS330_12820 [Amycolatopsis keratiniphila subsp. nogabecina]ONF72187.1 hypothetical protein AVR91_0211690 [Amycolatopsis keratiniphila subsp. keratiniphila]SDU44143.1 hypothetical protein SAMN04489733_4300 [Amycolatopsis keratiniphila]